MQALYAVQFLLLPQPNGPAENWDVTCIVTLSGIYKDQRQAGVSFCHQIRFFQTDSTLWALGTMWDVRTALRGLWTDTEWSRAALAQAAVKNKVCVSPAPRSAHPPGLF